MGLIKKAYELEGKTKISAIIYGQPSVGKTVLSLSAPNPLHIDLERGATRIDPPELMGDASFAEINNYKELIDLINSPEVNEFDTLIFDTLGKMVDLIMNYITGGELKQPRIQDWGELKRLFSQIIKNVVNVKNKNIIIIAHETEEKTRKGSEDIIVKRPKCSGTSWRDLLGDIDLMGYMQITEQGERSISFYPTTYYYAKDSLDLPLNIIFKKYKKAEDNNFFTEIIMKRLEKKNEERKRMGKTYYELIERQKKIIDEAKDIKGLNEALKILKGDEAIGDSTFRWKKMLKERQEFLGADFDVDSKIFSKKDKDYKFYITPSLYMSYYMHELGIASRNDFLNSLNRVIVPPNELMQMGIEFENAIKRESEYIEKYNSFSSNNTDNAPKMIEAIKKAAEIVKGGLWQQKIRGKIICSIGNIGLHGTADVIKNDLIYDVKYTGSKYQGEKFFDSIQHLLYMYGSGIKQFSYLIFDGNKLFTEDYSWNEEQSKNELLQKINDFIKFVYNDDELKQAYESNWG